MRLVSTQALASALLGIAYGPAIADQIHVVQPGETLWQIAAALSGNPHRWPELYRANRDQIKDPSLLYPGQRLATPGFGAERGRDPSPAVGASPETAD